jgi:CubicO group peptidase (beta-lactamase class C family)
MSKTLLTVLIAAPLSVSAQTPGAQNIADPGIEPWQLVPADEVGSICRLDHDLLQQVTPPEGAAFAVVRYGRWCYVSEEGPTAGDRADQAFSVTKTLGATLTGMVMRETRELPPSEEFGKGPLREFDRADHWIDLNNLAEGGDIHPDATIAHILSMEAYNDSLAFGDKEHRYDANGRREINYLIEAIDRAQAQDPARFGADALAARDRLFTKLGLEHSEWAVQSFGSSWNTSMKDMARLGLLLLNGGVYNGERILDAQYVYNMTHPAFEDGSTAYGYLTWLSPADCAPQAIHRSYPHGVSQATSCMLENGCEQQYDVGVFSAIGARGQYIIGHRGLNMLIIGQNWQGDDVPSLWDAVRPAVIAADPVYQGDVGGFCSAYAAGDYAPDLIKWAGDL